MNGVPQVIHRPKAERLEDGTGELPGIVASDEIDCEIVVAALRIDIVRHRSLAVARYNPVLLGSSFGTRERTADRCPRTLFSMLLVGFRTASR